MTCNYCGRIIPEGYVNEKCPHCHAELKVELPYTAMQEVKDEEKKKRRAK